MQDSIADTRGTLRDELLKIAFGVWDHIKNRGDHGADNWELEWVGFLPGKRGKPPLCGRLYAHPAGSWQPARPFPGCQWPTAAGQMDNHLPGGFFMDAQGGAHLHQLPVRARPIPSPIRCLYSRNIENLMFAGRNISASHLAISSTRVMAT